MPRFLIEVNHRDAHQICQTVLEAIEKHGSHFLDHVEWGCQDGVHSGWLIVDVADHETAQLVVPPELRQNCRIIQLNRWTKEDLIALSQDQS